MFKYSIDNKRYHTLNYFYKNKFNSKVFKVSLNAGFSCPNKVNGRGCIFCSKLGSGDFAGNASDDLKTQFESVKKKLDKKWPNSKYIAYFQANTNTFAPLELLKEKYETVLKIKNVIGISIATRSDAITDDILDYLTELNKETFLTIELGLQSIKDETLRFIKRGHDLKNFEVMVKKLKTRGINVIVHIINGLPYETKEDMLETVRYLNKLKIDGIKIHMLSIIKNTELADIYENSPFPLLSKKDYVDIVCNQLELLKPEIVIHRITGDPKEEDLIEPKWVMKKFEVLNDIDKEMLKRGSYQGINLSILNRFQQILITKIKNKDLVIDATSGNGLDTLFLSNLVPNGHVFAFDIQMDAINKTENILIENKKSNGTVFHLSHSKMLSVLSSFEKKISAVVFNLGYLPKGNKTITTKTRTTIKAIKDSLKLIHNKGIILIVIYSHKEGQKEEKAILKLLKNMEHQLITKTFRNTSKKNAPYLISVEKKIID